MSKWKKYLLSELVEFNPDNLNKNYRYKEIFYLDISSVGEGFAEFNEPISLSKAPSRAKRLVLPNDTIIATVRPGNRSFYYFNKFPENTVVSTGFAVIRGNEQKIAEECINESNFLFTYYTDIFNKVKKDEIDINLLYKFLDILKKIEDNELDQHEGSFMVGTILKQIYVDSALKKAEKLDELNEKTQEPKKAEVKISWNQFKKMKN